jgi:ribosomal protein S18 acetylase RimI-like enzyme
MERARRARTDDLPALVRLAAELRAELRVLRGGRLWEQRDARVRPDEETLAGLLRREDAAVVVGTIDGVVVGYGTLEVEPLPDGTALAVIGDLYVEPGARDVGVGESIATELVAAAEAAGCVGIDAFALPGHREAKNFFERAGFTARALVMHRPLTGPPVERDGGPPGGG